MKYLKNRKTHFSCSFSERTFFLANFKRFKKNIVCSFTLTTHAYSFRTAPLFMLVTPSRVQTSFIVQPLCCTTVPPRIIQPPSRRLARIGGVFYVFILLIENEAGDPYIYTLDKNKKLIKLTGIFSRF